MLGRPTVYEAYYTHSFRLAAKEEVFDIEWVVNFSTILAFALLNSRYSVFTLGARGQDSLQLIGSGVDEILDPGTLAVTLHLEK